MGRPVALAAAWAALACGPAQAQWGIPEPKFEWRQVASVPASQESAAAVVEYEAAAASRGADKSQLFARVRERAPSGTLRGELGSQEYDEVEMGWVADCQAMRIMVMGSAFSLRSREVGVDSKSRGFVEPGPIYRQALEKICREVQPK